MAFKDAPSGLSAGLEGETGKNYGIPSSIHDLQISHIMKHVKLDVPEFELKRVRLSFSLVKREAIILIQLAIAIHYSNVPLSLQEPNLKFPILARYDANTS